MPHDLCEDNCSYHPYHEPGCLVFDIHFDICLVVNSLSSLKINACV